MTFIENNPTNEAWEIPCSNYHMVWFEAMKHTKLGTMVDFREGEKLGQLNKGWVTCITTLGVNVTTTTKTVFVKWPNVVGVYA